MTKPAFALRHLLPFLLLILLAATAARADEPFRRHRYDLLRSLPADTADILFAGNSITDMFPWDEAFPALPGGGRVLNRGVSGALSDEILANIGAFVSGHPRKLFLMIGTNDLGSGLPPRHIADNVARIIDTVRSISPATQIYLQSILPSTVGLRTLADEQAANSLLRHIADTSSPAGVPPVVFIDLWQPLMGILDDPRISLDGLHLTACGYRLWLDIIEPHIGAGSNSFAPCRCDTPANAGIGKSNLMRASYFRALPGSPGDILFFGDEMVKCGEWVELTSRRNLLNRATGWGYDGTSPSIAATSAMARAALSGRACPPAAILLCTGTGDINGSAPLDSVCGQYLRLLDTIARLAPGAPIYLVSLLPAEHPSRRISSFNQWLCQLARQAADPQSSLLGDRHAVLRHIDLYTPLAIGDSANSAYFSGSYLMADGYRLAARRISQALDRPYGNDFLTLSLLQSRRSAAAGRRWVAVSNTFLLSPLPAVGHLLCGRGDSPEAASIRAEGYEMGAALLLTAAVTMGVKGIVRRPRPWAAYPGELECLQPVPSHSFPSGHTSFAFSAATSLTLAYPRWYVALPAYLWAGAVGYSRMYVGAHYPSDVIAGAILGTACAATVRLLRLRISQDRPGWAPANAVIVPMAFSF